MFNTKKNNQKEKLDEICRLRNQLKNRKQDIPFNKILKLKSDCHFSRFWISIRPQHVTPDNDYNSYENFSNEETMQLISFFIERNKQHYEELNSRLNKLLNELGLEPEYYETSS